MIKNHLTKIMFVDIWIKINSLPLCSLGEVHPYKSSPGAQVTEPCWHSPKTEKQKAVGWLVDWGDLPSNTHTYSIGFR